MAMDKDTWLAENIFPKNEQPNNRKPRLNVKPVTVTSSIRKTKVTLCILGSWAIYMPPYNLARLSALTRESGYQTRVFDFNVESYYDLKEANPDLVDAWNGANYYLWNEPSYSEKIHPSYEPILKKYIQKIIEEDIDILGFSTYTTNLIPTEWVIREIKKIKPEITIVMGGPECHNRNFKMIPESDYFFLGESEQNFLDFLNNWENGIKPESQVIGSLYSDVRIDIDSLPYPDYSDFQLEKYLGKNSICAEISRGCIAKCSYCTEVYYWKFRDRGASNIVDELEYQVKKYGINFVSFVDSLMNGNLKEFKLFCEQLVQRNLGLTWWGYARIDGRMDLNFYKLMKAAGCQGFNYGIESGSDKVLSLVNKKNTVAEINQNLIDSNKVGMKVSACLVLGAPGEDIEAFAHTLTMLWNHRNHIIAVSPGPGLIDSNGSDYDNREKYNLNTRNNPFLGGWYTLDYKNTILHRMIRVKLTHIWLDVCKKFCGTVTNVHSSGNIADHYKVDFLNYDVMYEELSNEIFDYNLINSGLGEFADSLMNEIFGFLRLLWRSKGGYEIVLNFSDELDHKDFMFVINPDYYSFESNIRFKIDDDGAFEVLNYYKFNKKIDDDVHAEIKNFEYTFNSTGQWTSGKKIKSKKIIFLSPVAGENNLPMESCFSSMGISERKLLQKISNYMPSDGCALDIGFDIGGKACIIADQKNSAKVYSANLIKPHEISKCRDYLYEDWLFDQLVDCHRNKKDANLVMLKEDIKEFINNLKNIFNTDYSGLAVKKELVKKFNNIQIVDIDDQILNNQSYDLIMVSTVNCDLYLPKFAENLKPSGKILIHLYGLLPSVTAYVNDMIASKLWKITEQVDYLVVIEKC